MVVAETIIQERSIEILPPMGAHVAAFDAANGAGLMFAAIVPGSNAEAAGLLPRDQVISINGTLLVHVFGIVCWSRVVLDGSRQQRNAVVSHQHHHTCQG